MYPLDCAGHGPDTAMDVALTYIATPLLLNITIACYTYLTYAKQTGLDYRGLDYRLRKRASRLNGVGGDRRNDDRWPSYADLIPLYGAAELLGLITHQAMNSLSEMSTEVSIPQPKMH
jgi:hypothetical protein